MDSLDQSLPDLPAGMFPNNHHSSALTRLLDHHILCHHLLSLLHCLLYPSYLADVHARVTAQRPDGGEIVGPEQSGDDSVLVDLTDHGGVHEVHQAVFIHGDACQSGVEPQ